MELIDTKEAARRLGVSPTRVQQLLLTGRIAGATKLGEQRGTWVIEVETGLAPAVIGGDRRRKPPR